jgi:dienelactone hydrolase
MSARTLLLLVGLLLVGAPAVAQPLSFDSSTVGTPGSDARAELFAPEGAGPFPAVILLHGCNGVSPFLRIWARRFVEWGYVALVVDSFRPRGLTLVCTQPLLVPPELRALDAFNAADYLRSLANVRADRIGIIGFSHGGWTVMQAVRAGAERKPFAAAVAFYPWCDTAGGALTTDTLILIGEADDWTPADRCLRFRELIQPDGRMLRLKTYPGALHAFDAPIGPMTVFGHRIGGDPAAAADAIAETRAFLAERLDR